MKKKGLIMLNKRFCLIIVSVILSQFISKNIFAITNSVEIETNNSAINERLREADEVAKSEKEKDQSFAFAPLISSDPMMGTMVGATAMYFFKADNSSDKTQKSIIQPIAMYSNTDSYFAGIIGQLFFNEDKQRLTGFIGTGRVRNQFENISSLGSVDFTTEFTGGLLKYQHEVLEQTYLGWELVGAQIKYSPDNTLGGIYLGVLGVDEDEILGTGPSITFDSTDSTIAPQKGILAEVKVIAFPDRLNEEEYVSLEGFFNYYTKTRNEKDVFALRTYGRYTDDAPYSGKSTVGRGADLRAYKGGEFIADNLVTLQGEYRWKASNTVGFVGFAGVGALFNNNETITSEEVYPSAGLGIRYAIMPEQNMNFRIDYAVGKDNNQGIYVSVREAF